jgi:hypothetical protein
VLAALLAQRLMGQCTYDFTADYEQLTRLANENQVRTGSTDSVTIPVGHTPASDLMETWYVPRFTTACGAGTSPLYRVFNSAIVDHADSPSQTELPGYASDITLGCPWNSSSRDGLNPLTRYLKTSPANDYLTWLDSGVSPPPPAGYNFNAAWSIGSGTPLLGYQRFGNLLTDFSQAYGTYFLDNSFLHIDFNKLWGNAIGNITFGTFQVVKNPGPGFLVQTVAWWSPGINCSLANPTQSGATPCNGRNPLLWEGSPVTNIVRTGTDPSQPQTLTSTVRPFDFCSSGQQWPNTDIASPLAWRGLFQRADTLSCRLNGTVRKDVLASTSEAMLAEGATRTSQGAGQWNTYWLNEPNDATSGNVTLDWKNLRTGVVTSIPISYTNGSGGANGSFSLNSQGSSYSVCATNGPGCTVNAGGDSVALIVASTSGSPAYALAFLNPQSSLDDRLNVSFSCNAPSCSCGTPPCTSPSVTVVLNGQRVNGSFSNSSWSQPLTNQLIVNNHSSILTRLGELYTYGGSCL